MSYYVEKRGANHGLHLVLSLLTCGMWAVTGWPIAAILGRTKTVTGSNYQHVVLMPPVAPAPYEHPAYRSTYMRSGSSAR